MVKTKRVLTTQATATKQFDHFQILAEIASQLGEEFEADKNLCKDGFTEVIGPNYIIIRSNSSDNIALIDKYLIEKCHIIPAKDAKHIFINLNS